MPKSSRHKSNKQSKHSSRDYSDSEEDVVKMKEKYSKDNSSTRSHRDLASGEKRKISSHAREGKESKDMSSHGNGDVLVLEELLSSKRRKEKSDVVVVGGDRWNGGGDEKGDSERHVEKEMNKLESLKVDNKLEETNSKGEALRVESKSKSKRYDSGTVGEKKEDLASAVVEKEENKSKGESKRKSERDSSLRKEGKDSKDKDRKLDKEKNVCQESKSGDTEVKLVDMDVAKKQGTQLVELSGERQGKRSREINERTSLDELRNIELDKAVDKKIHKKREGSTEREKYYDEPKESDLRRLSSKDDHAKDLKYRDDKHRDDDKHKDGNYADKYQEDGHKDDRRRDEKYREEGDKDNKHSNDKYREDGGERDARRKSSRHREDRDRDNRRKDEKYRDDGERDSRRNDDKYHEGVKRDKYREDGDRNRRHKDDQNHETGDKDIRRGGEGRYYEDGDRDRRYKEEKYREDIERDLHYKDSKQRDGVDREKRQKDTKYKDDRNTRNHTVDTSDTKRSRDDDSPTRDDLNARYRDDQGRRKTYEKEDYVDIKSRGSKDQRSDVENKSASNARIDPVTDRVKPNSRNVDIEVTPSHGRRRSSPTSSSHAPRDNYRAAKQDDSKYRDYNYDERPRQSMNSTRDYTGPLGGSEKPSSSRPSDKLVQKDDAHFGDLSSERRLKSDTRSSPLQLVDKSPSFSTDRRQFTRPDKRRNTDVAESIQKSGGSRDYKEYSAKDVHPAEEFVQTDADTVSVSSPFIRNSHFSKSFAPPPPSFRTTNMDSPSLLGTGEDDARAKPNLRHNRRIIEPNMGGRVQGSNAWRGVPSWPSPVPNGFLSYPHAQPFHTVMQPFPAPPMFGVRPSMELNHHSSPYHIPDNDRFSGPGRPIGWRNQVDVCPPYAQWRSEWDHTRSMSGGARGWETSADLWKGPNRTVSTDVPSSEKEINNLIRTGDEDQTRVDQEEDIATDDMQLTACFDKAETGVALVNSDDSGDVAKVSRKDDVPLCHVYLSKLEISSELTEPELFVKCAGLIDSDKIICSNLDDSKILYVEDAKAKLMSPGVLNLTLFAPTDDSVFKKSMSLYKRQKESFRAEYIDKPRVSSEFIPNFSPEGKIVQEDNTEKLCPTNNIEKITETLQGKIDQPAGIVMTENLDLEKHDNEDKPLSEERVDVSDAIFQHVKDVSVGSRSKNEEVKSVDTKYDPLLNFDVSSETSEAMMPESVDLSRIHLSPEITH